MPRSQPPAGGPLAAIDIGSNSFRLEIGDLQHGRYRRVAYLKETVRLGAGLDAASLLSEPAALRGLDCLARFAERLQGFAEHRVRAVATQTLREARNRNAFLARAEPVLGFPIEVISGREEARLIYSGVAHLQPSEHQRLVIDIGGRSTEMILGQGLKPSVAESFQVGSVSLSMRWFGDGQLNEAAFRAAQVAAGAELEEALTLFAPNLWTEALGSSGTVGAIAQILKSEGRGEDGITPADLRWCIERCLRAGHIDKLQFASMRDDRRAVIAGGLALLYTLQTHFGIERLHEAKGALRQGVIIDLDARLRAASQDAPGDPRELTVLGMQRRFGADAVQAERVAAVALKLHDSALADADPEWRRELAWACALHEIGLMVSHHDHHRHSAYLVAHADAAGFSQSQQRRIADLVLAQRGGLRKMEAQLANPNFAWQALALRLAIIECHARSAAQAGAIRLRRTGPRAELRASPDWALANPRTVHLLHEEAQAWARHNVLSLDLSL